MATASFIWTNWDTTNAWENLADAGNSASVTYARDATDIAAKFTQVTKNVTQTEFGRKSGTGDTWASIFGISTSATVTQIQVTAWTKKLVANTKLTSHSVTIALIDDSGSRVTASDSISAVVLGTTLDGSYVAQSAGSTVNVNAGSQAATSSVRLSLEYTVTTAAGGGSASVDQRFDGVEITITYSNPVEVAPSSGSVIVTGFAPTIGLPVTILPGFGSAIATGFAPTISSSTPVNIEPGSGSVIVTGFAPTISLPVTVQPGSGTLIAIGFAPTIGLPITIAPGSGDVVVVGFVPDLGYGGGLIMLLHSRPAFISG